MFKKSDESELRVIRGCRAHSPRPSPPIFFYYALFVLKSIEFSALRAIARPLKISEPLDSLALLLHITRVPHPTRTSLQSPFPSPSLLCVQFYFITHLRQTAQCSPPSTTAARNSYHRLEA